MSDRQSGNRGIIGPVTGDNIAVGDAAQIIHHHEPSARPGRAELDEALQSLKTQIEGLNLTSDMLVSLRVDLELLRREVDHRPKTPSAAASTLQSLVEKLKLAGVVADTLVSFAKPIKTVSSWFGLLPPG